MRKINLIWRYRKEGRRKAEEARRERDASKESYDRFVQDTLNPMRKLQSQNHFAEILAESLARGYDRK